jgi:Protein of unknown function (DUF1479)
VSAQLHPGTAVLPPLPHWEQPPADLPAAIRQVKAALRARIAASGRTVEEVFAVVERLIEAEAGEITAALHTVPIPGAMAYLMLRPLLADVPDDDMCGVIISQAFPATATWHSLLLRALTGIPDVQGGDSVWWHCDMIHSVAPVKNQQGWGNVMYIPAAPWCPRNQQYAPSVRDAFRTGSSPSDFPAEHYERTWASRFQPQDLNGTGRRGIGLL